MISRIEGVLLSVAEGRAEVRCGHLTFAVLVPGIDQQRLAGLVGENIVFHSLSYLEGAAQGANFTPRLIGFASPSDRAFFEVFTTVKGIGNRKALRALQLPFARVAEAIAAKDVDMLKSLPEVGKRTAETIIAELHGKVDAFLEPRAASGEGTPATPRVRAMTDDAITVLVTLGEPKLSAMLLVDRALAADPTLESANVLVTAALRLKSLPG